MLGYLPFKSSIQAFVVYFSSISLFIELLDTIIATPWQCKQSRICQTQSSSSQEYWPKYVSLSNESWETNGRELFGKQFEQCLKQRAETAKSISTTSFVQRGKPFFLRSPPLTQPWNRRGVACDSSTRFWGQSYCPSRPFRGRGKTTANSPSKSHQTNEESSS